MLCFIHYEVRSQIDHLQVIRNAYTTAAAAAATTTTTTTTTC
jgi:hypothetical protein